MDIISHALWAAAAAKGAQPKIKRKLNLWIVALWGAFPDLFAFTIPFIWMGVELISGRASTFRFHPEGNEPPSSELLPIYNLASSLYNISHSLFVFALAAGLAWLLLRRVPWEMGGWLLHLLMDIPTHTYAFFATPIFWPFSGYKFSGIQWAQWWFLILDYSALLLVFYLLRKRDKKTRQQKTAP